MPDIVNSNFDARLQKPLDGKRQRQSMNDLYTIPLTSRWQGMDVHVISTNTTYYLIGGLDNSFWVPWNQITSGGGLLPNGIVIYGESQQSGNDILLNDAWVWRIDQVDYQSSDDVITIAPAAAGNVRVDIIVGDNLSNFVLVTGNEVASPGPAIEPNIPPNTVPLLRVEVSDTGITAFEDFALSAFVRFDINNQGLIPSQRQNARTNIQAVSKDTDDTRIGTLSNTGTVSILSNEGSTSLSGPLISLNTGEDGTASFDMLSLLNTSGGGMTVQKRGSTDIIGKGDSVTDYFILRLRGSDALVRVEANNNGILANQRSAGETYLTRRDENYLTYPVTISGTGKLNDVALSNGVGAIKFSSGVTEVSGIDPNGDTKELLIWSDNPTGITLPAEDVLSIAANRFYRDVNIPYQTWVRLVYNGDLARWVNSNTGELQETDARYFEVTSDVLTLKYILPDIAALQAFVRGPAVLAYVSDSVRGGYFNYVAEVDFGGVPDFGISFPAQDGGYWVRRRDGEIRLQWWDVDPLGVDDSTVGVQAFFTAILSVANSYNTRGKTKGIIHKGFFRCTSTISMTDCNGVTIEGQGVDASIIFLDASNDTLFNITRYIGLTFSDITILTGSVTYSSGIPQVSILTDPLTRTNKAFSFTSLGGGTRCFFNNVECRNFDVVLDSTVSGSNGDFHVYTNCSFHRNNRVWDNTNIQAVIWRFDHCQMHYNEYCFYNPGVKTMVTGGDYINPGTFLYSRLASTTNGFLALGVKFETLQNDVPAPSPKWIDILGDFTNIEYSNCSSRTASTNLNGKIAFKIGQNSSTTFRNCYLDGDMEINVNSIVLGITGKVIFDNCQLLPPITQTTQASGQNAPFNIQILNQKISGANFNSYYSRIYNGFGNTTTQESTLAAYSTDSFFWQDFVNANTKNRTFSIKTLESYPLFIKKVIICCETQTTQVLDFVLWTDSTKTTKILEFSSVSAGSYAKQIYEKGLSDFLNNPVITNLSDPLFFEFSSTGNVGNTQGKVYFELVQSSDFNF